MAAPLLLFDSYQTKPSGNGLQGGEQQGPDSAACHDLGAELLFLSGKLLLLRAIVNKHGWTNAARDKELCSTNGTAVHLLDGCVSNIVKISKELLDAYDSLYRDKSKHFSDHRSHELTRREVEVVRFLAEGKCNKEIASALRLSVKTVETYRSRIMLKLCAHSLSDVTRFAVRHGIITIDLHKKL